MIREISDAYKIPGKKLETETANELIMKAADVLQSSGVAISFSESEKQFFQKCAQDLRNPRPTTAELHLLAFCVMMWVASTASRTSDIPISVSLQKSPAVLDAYLSQILWNLAHLKQPMHFELSPTDREWIIRYCLQH